MTERAWSDTYLDSLRHVGDEDADNVVKKYFAALGRDDPSGLFHGVLKRDGEVAVPEVAAFLHAPADPPDWVNWDTVAAGQERFARWGGHVFTALYAASLPSAYACKRGVQVLGATAQLEKDTRRRMNETAQFLLHVMEPGGLEPDGAGFSDVRHVRLMHAAVRHMMLVHTDVRWDEGWGKPINQEDLLETLLTFTEIVFEVFDKTGVTYSDDDAEAYLHTWSYVGHILGVLPDRLPLSRADTRALMPIVRRRQFGPSEAGTLLTGALLDEGRKVSPPGFRGLPATTVRYYVGDTVADSLGVPPADWTRSLFGPLASVTRVLSAEKAHQRMLTTFSDRIGMRLMRMAVNAGRVEGRAEFAIPTTLADRWGVSVKGVPRGADRRRARRVERGRTAG